MQNIAFVLAFALLLTACSTTTENTPIEDLETDQNEEQDLTMDETKTYDWTAQDVSFEYPRGYNVLESAENRLAITTANEFPDGDTSVSWTFFEVRSDAALNEVLAEYSKEESFTQSTTTIGQYEFTKISFYMSFGGFTSIHYLLEMNGNVLDYTAGEGEEALALQILESIQF